MSTTPTLLANLRHLYENMVNGGVRDTASAKRIAEGLLSPAIAELERAALTQGAGEAVEPVAWPRNAAEVRQFMNSNCEAVEFAVDEATPDDGDRYQLTAHDFLSAVNWWADFPHHPSEEVAQQLQQAVARALAERDQRDREQQQNADARAESGAVIQQACEAAIRAKGTHD